ncbi:MAG: hypothetical protein K6G26_09715 [Lachnospiraceae bacterium]|nr:hypothetical protein [Lachnospiraceae bacterium]
MKKIKYVIMIVMTAVLLSGCVRIEGTMEIKKNGKADANFLIAAMDYNEFGLKSDSEDASDEEEKIIDSAITPEMVTEIKDAGWAVDDYKDGYYTGYEINKKNMPLTEAGDDIKELTAILEKSPVLKKDAAEFEKQAYVEEKTDEQVNIHMDGLNLVLDVKLMEQDKAKNLSAVYKYINMFDGSAKFILKLPFAPTKSNATSVDNNGKTLEWDFLELEDNNIHIEYNILKPLIIIALVFILLIAILVVIIRSVSKKKKKKRVNSL